MPYKHIPGVIVEAKFTKENGNEYRHWMQITLVGASKNPLTACVVMQNPSYAGEEIADKSVQFMEKNVFTRGLSAFTNVERLLVVNQFARVQTNAFAGLTSDIGQENDNAIRTAIQQSEIVVIGWGVKNRFKERQAFVHKVLASNLGKRLYRTSSHPSRGRYEGFIIPIDSHPFIKGNIRQERTWT